MNTHSEVISVPISVRSSGNLYDALIYRTSVNAAVKIPEPWVIAINYNPEAPEGEMWGHGIYFADEKSARKAWKQHLNK